VNEAERSSGERFRTPGVKARSRPRGSQARSPTGRGGKPQLRAHETRAVWKQRGMPSLVYELQSRIRRALSTLRIGKTFCGGPKVEWMHRMKPNQPPPQKSLACTIRVIHGAARVLKRQPPGRQRVLRSADAGHRPLRVPVGRDGLHVGDQPDYGQDPCPAVLRRVSSQHRSNHGATGG
jgi:hypothetical protein